MGSIASPGFNNLAQVLAGSGAWLASAALLSPSGQTDLQNGAVGDLVQLSDAALQLPMASALFGTGGSSSAASLLSTVSTPNYGWNSLVPSLDSSLLASSSSRLDSLSTNLTPSLKSSTGSQQNGLDSSSSGSSFGANLAAYVSQLQLANAQTLFGLDSTGGSSPGVNLLA